MSGIDTKTATGDGVTVTQRLDLVTKLGSESGQGGLLAVGAIAFAGECLFLAMVPPVEGFENSLIEAYPVGFWFLFTVALVASVLVFVGTALSYSDNWRYAFGLLAVNYGVFFLLPAHRGYALYGRGEADVLAHLGITRELIQTSSLPGVFYPIEHLLLSTLSMHGLSLPLSRYLLGYGLTLLFIASVGVLVRELVGDRRGLPAGLAAASPLVFTEFNVSASPSVLSVLLFPVVLFLLERSRKHESIGFRVCYVLLALTVLVFHPVTALLLGILVTSTIAFQRLYGSIQGGVDAPRSGTEWLGPKHTRLTGILLVAGVAWYSNFGRTRRALERVIDGAGRARIVSGEVQQAEQAGLSVVEVVVRFGQLYGTLFVYLAIAGLFGLVVLYRLSRRDIRYVSTYIALQAAIGVGIALLFMSIYLIESNAIRVSRYAAVMAVLAVGVTLYHLTSERTQGRRGLVTALTAAIVVAAVLGSFGGVTYGPNGHLTYSEYRGAEFVLTHQDPDDVVRSSSLTSKTQEYITGEPSRPGESPVFQNEQLALPPGLGYEANETAAETFAAGSYLVTHTYDLEFDEASYFFPQQRERLGVYEERHVQQLDRDSTVDEVYTNGGFSLWKLPDAAPEATEVQ